MTLNSRYAYEHQNDHSIKGVIASAPLIALGAKTQVSTPEYYGIRLLSYVLGTFTIQNPVDPSNLTRDPKVNKAYTEDPLVHAYTSMGTAKDIVLNGEQLAGTYCQGFALPLLITCGTEDYIISYDAAKQFYEKVASSDKTWKSYDGLCHECTYHISLSSLMLCNPILKFPHPSNSAQ